LLHAPGNGRDIYRQACNLELEGIVCRRKDGRYRSGRNDTWVKVTCRHRETFCAETAALRML
jgi:bifunctional non-homologous end joining protein LigD